MRRRLLLFLCLFLAQIAWTQTAVEEKGLPIIENYSSKYYKAHPQNFAIEQDPRGVLYFANAEGLLEFDGVNWNLFQDLGEPPVYSLLHDSKKLWLGLDSDFGYLDAEPNGKLLYKSVLNMLDTSIMEEGEFNFGQIWNILQNKEADELYFQSDYYLFIYHDGKFTSLDSENRIRKSFLSRGVLYLDIEEQGLSRILDNKLVKVPGAIALKGSKVQMLTKISERKSLIVTANNGLFEMGINDYGYEVYVKPLDNSLSSYLKDREVEDLLVLDNKRIAIGLYGKGLIIVEDLKSIVLSINRETGLQNDLVEGLAKDKQGNLWIALNNGISKLELNFPISAFGEEMGLQGTIESCVRFNKKLYAAGSEGIYSLDSYKNEAYDELKYRFSEELPEQAWKLNVFKEQKGELLVACLNNEVISIDPRGRIESILECYPWTAKQSTFHPDWLFVGMDPGFSIVEKENGDWKNMGSIMEIDEPIDQLLEIDENTLWLGSRAEGIYRVTGLKITEEGISYDAIDYFGAEQKLPEGPVRACLYENRLLFATSEGIYELGPDDTFIPSNSFVGEEAESFVYRLETSPDGRLWAIVPMDKENHFGPFEKSEGKLSMWNTPFNTISTEMIYSFFFEGDSTVWLTGANGIYKYDVKQAYDYKQNFNVLIRKVKLNYDSVIFDGVFKNEEGEFITEQPESYVYEFEHDQNSFVFEFAAQAEAAPEKQLYSYMLKGFADTWSKWKPESKAVFTNLPPGDYELEVKAKNIFKHESKPNYYRFSIAKPWWQSTWYYLGQTLFFLILIVLTVLLNRGGGSSKFAEIVALITIITLFEFVIINIEPIFDSYTGGVPVFQLLMNILLALSLSPVESFIKKRIAKKRK